MMRFQQAAAACIGALLLLPRTALWVGAQEVDLAARLERVQGAIEELLGLEQRLRGGERAALDELREATEAPDREAAQYDATVVALRADVGRLHEVLDSYSSEGLTEAQALAAARGLGPAEREALNTIAQRSGVPPLTVQPLEAPAAQAAPTPARAFESDPAYSADAVRQAQLLLRAGREVEAIALLEPLHGAAQSDTPEVRYWWARAHERAQLFQPALAVYDELAQDPSAGRFAERARLDREFLRVKLELTQAKTTPPLEDGR